MRTEKNRTVIREDYSVNKPAGFLSKHTLSVNTSIQLCDAVVMCVAWMPDDDDELWVFFTFCSRQKIQIETCIEHSNHATMVRTCYIFVTNLINSDYTHSNSLLYDDQKSDTTDTVQTTFEHTLQSSVNCVEIKLMRARYPHANASKTIPEYVLVTVAGGGSGDDSFATLRRGNEKYATVSFNETRR